MMLFFGTARLLAAVAFAATVGLYSAVALADNPCSHPLGEDPCAGIEDAEERERCQLGIDCDPGTAVPELSTNGMGAAVTLLLGGLAVVTAHRRTRSR